MSNKGNEELNMSREELQRWVREQVNKDERLVRRRAQLAQVEEWVKQKEIEANYNQLLYTNASESVLECESVMKGLYGMLGLEYHDTDSEEEEGAKSTENVTQIQNDTATKQEVETNPTDVDDDYVVIDLGAAVNEAPREELELCASPTGTQLSESSEKTLACTAKNSPSTIPTTQVNLMATSRFNQSVTKVPTMTREASGPTTNPTPKESFLTSDGLPITINTTGSPIVATHSAIPFAPMFSSEGPETLVSETLGSFAQTSRLSVNSGSGSSENRNPVSSDTSSTTPVQNNDIVKKKLDGSKDNKKYLSPPKPKPIDGVSSSADPKPINKSSNSASLKIGINPSSSTGPKSSLSHLESSNESLSSATPKPSNEHLSSASPKPSNDRLSRSEISEPNNDPSSLVNLKPSEDLSVSTTTKSRDAPEINSSFKLRKTKPKSVSPESSNNQSSPASQETLSPTHHKVPLRTTSPPKTEQSVISNQSHEPPSRASPKATKKPSNPSPNSSNKPLVPASPLRSNEPSCHSRTPPVPNNELSNFSNPNPCSKPSISAVSSASISSSSITEKTNDPNPGCSATSPNRTPNTEVPTSSTVTSTQSGTTQTSCSETVTSSSANNTGTSSAVHGRVQKAINLKVNMSVLGKRRTKTWHQGTILDIKTTETGLRYKVLFDGSRGKSVLSAHHLACVQPPLLKDLFVGCRVVASYKESDQSWLLAAIVAEMPDRRNRMRFLVFFDDGHAAYIALPDLHLVCNPLSNVCNDIEDKEWREDVEEYLEAYPNPVFVVMRVGQESKALRDGKLEPCVVTQVDSSLIEVSYKKNQEKEWLYKGCNRLEQIQRIKSRLATHRKEQANDKAGWIQNPKTSKPATTSSTAATSTAVTTESTASQPPASQSDSSSSVSSTLSSTVSTSSSSSSLATAKSGLQPKIILNRIKVPSSKVTPDEQPQTIVQTEPTVSASSPPSIISPSPEETSNTSNNAFLPLRMPRLKYVPHRCCPACLYQVRPAQRSQHLGQNPLLIPLLYGFRRMTARKRLDGKVSFHVFYRSPCGRSMCEMEEVQDFLFESRCDFLLLDMFCLDPFILVKRATTPSSMVNQPHLYLPDISEGKEKIPIPCVNEVDSTRPDPLTYTRNSQPAPGIFINTNLDFMVGCDCTDGCRDRSKCACHQLTIDATSLCAGGPVDVTAGYSHKRLPRYVPSGVYECNPLCRCDPLLCGNRLVQHGLQLRLEVFMTHHKGWGIRCLDDIAKGTFVCTFTGKIVTDEMVSAKGASSANEYLANLDYIEGVEKLKEGYESEAFCSETDEESDKKTCITMTTGALKKHGVFQVETSSSSSEEKEEPTQKKSEENKISGKRKRNIEDDEESLEEDFDDEDYEISLDEGWMLNSDYKKSYATRRNAKILDVDKLPYEVQKPPSSKLSVEQAEVTASVAKQMRKEGPGESLMGYAKKSTRSFAIKSSHRRVKPLAVTTTVAQVQKTKTVHVRKCTRSLFDGEKGCYLIDSKQEGNLARYINHSCSPNLFVQNVFVDSHDLRFPWVAFFTNKRIRAGTELTWDYGYEVGSVEGKVLLCCCGSVKCTGRLL